MPIRVVIADEDLLFQEGLRHLIETQADIDVIGETGDSLEAMVMVKSLRPDVLLLDIAMLRFGGIETVRLVRDTVPKTKIVLLSGHETTACALKALEAGAQGNVLKGGPHRDLLEAIRAVHCGGIFFSQPPAEVISSYLKTRAEKVSTSEYDLLSEWEKRVFKLFIEGNTTIQISESLCVSPKIVEKHRAEIDRKIGFSNTVEMIRYAIRIGIIDPDFWKS